MPRRAYAKYAAGVAGCLFLAYFPFVKETRVPMLGGVDLGFHELGHLLTYWLPDPVTAVMGSVFQIAVPLGLAAYFVWRREYLGAGLCLAWAGASARDVAVYVADAPYQLLPLIGGEHDWAYLLATWGWMDRADTVAGAVTAMGAIFVLAGIAVCIAGPWLDLRDREPSAPPPATPSPAQEGWAIIPPWEQGGSS